MFTYAAVPEPSGMFVGLTTVIALVALAAIIFAWGQYSAQPSQTQSPVRSALAVALSLLLLVPAAASASLIHGREAFSRALATMASPSEELEEAQQASLALNKQIVEEGAVLLKNDGALPLSAPGKVNVFGMGAVQPQYTTSLRGGDPRTNPLIVTLPEALEQVGLQVNADLIAVYESHLPDITDSLLYPLPGDKGEIVEIDPSSYQSTINAATNFSDTAIVVITRQGGEGGDLHLNMGEVGGDVGKHYLELQDVELDLLAQVTSRFEKVVVLVNAANQMELGFLDAPEISSALWVGEPGDNGFEGVASLLTGAVSPSGRLADTLAYDATSAPSYKNFGDFRYVKGDGTDAISNAPEGRMWASYVNYEEGIYVGYRYYETRWVDEDNQAAYAQTVQYPFGYGLSYTSFNQAITGFHEISLPKAPTRKDIGAAEVRVEVNVANEGDAAAKEVVQLYLQPPWEPGGIEKSYVELAGFTKTDEIAPGEQATVEVSIPLEQFAAFDEEGYGAYVIEAGEYKVALQANAHDVLETRKMHIEDTLVFDKAPASAAGAEPVKSGVVFVGARPSDAQIAQPLFEAANSDDLTHLSRNDWEGTEPADRRDPIVASEELLAELQDTSPTFRETEEVFQVVPGDLTLADVTGLSADDPLWDQYMAQFSKEELIGLVGLGGWVTEPIKGQGVPRSRAVDGPVGVIDYVDGTAGVGFASSVVLASTFNVALAREFGATLGQEANVLGYHGLYAPGMNIHRSPFGGRNFEYYSEDPYLSAQMGVATVTGYEDAGIYAHIKHFAVNEQETNRAGVATWLNEQAMREIYLAPFEASIKQGDAKALMGSYNRLGTRWTGGVPELNVDVLRGEWGFDGHLVTDFFDRYYMDPDQAVAGGIDLIESTDGDFPTELTTEDNDGLIALRTSARHILHTFANSQVVETEEVTVSGSDWSAIGAIGGLTLLLVGGLLLTTRPREPHPRASREGGADPRASLHGGASNRPT